MVTENSVGKTPLRRTPWGSQNNEAIEMIKQARQRAKNGSAENRGDTPCPVTVYSSLQMLGDTENSSQTTFKS